MKNILRVAFLSALLCACSTAGDSGADDSAEAEAELPTEEFEPLPGMRMSALVSVPGVTLSFDTVRGVCAPDTLVMWASYGGSDYLTNVIGSGDDFTLLTDHGRKELSQGGLSALSSIDFAPAAVLADRIDISRQALRRLNDSIYVRQVREMNRIVEDFFLSYGMTKYMSAPMAARWRTIYTEADAEGVDPINPFNRSQYIEFADNSLNVLAVDPGEGVVEVTAFCNDRNTVGQPGWAYWTVRMVRENGFFKVADTPAQHRKFAQ